MVLVARNPYDRPEMCEVLVEGARGKYARDVDEPNKIWMLLNPKLKKVRMVCQLPP